jgi:hypothetical protein
VWIEPPQCPVQGSRPIGAYLDYFTTLGDQLIDIPAKCTQASVAIAKARSAEKQAEWRHSFVMSTVRQSMATGRGLVPGLIAGLLEEPLATQPTVVTPVCSETASLLFGK